jgi:hypothetical protein
LAVPTSFVSPLTAAEIAVATLGVEIIAKLTTDKNERPHQQVYHLLSGMRRDIIKRSGVRELV